MKFITVLLMMLLVVPAISQQQASERQTVDLTIYNMNMALVREERTIDVAKGINRITVPDIPATIDGTSLHFKSLTDPLSVKVLEQNYQYDLLHHAKLMEKYIGKEVEFIRLNESDKREYSVKGKLLATGWQPQAGYSSYGGGSPFVYSGQMIAEINGKIEISPSGRLVLPALPQGLILKPQLEWLVAATRSALINCHGIAIMWHCWMRRTRSST
jgi:hypothetical protein